MSNILKNTKDVVKKMEEIINEAEPTRGNVASSNALEKLKAAVGLNRIRNERKGS